MTNAFLDFTILCPRCRAFYDDLVWMPWGLCGGDYNTAPVYRVGDRIRWRTHDDAGGPVANCSLVPSWLYQSQSPYSHRVPANLGDPAMPDVVVENIAYGDDFAECRECDEQFFIGAEIRSGTVWGAATASVDSATAVASRRFTRWVLEGPVHRVEWRTGLSEEVLAPVDEFLNSFDLTEPALPEPGQPFSESWGSATTEYFDLLRLVIEEGLGEFSERRLLHALASRLGKDPFFLQQQTPASALWPQRRRG